MAFWWPIGGVGGFLRRPLIGDHVQRLRDHDQLHPALLSQATVIPILTIYFSSSSLRNPPELVRYKHPFKMPFIDPFSILTLPMDPITHLGWAAASILLQRKDEADKAIPVQQA